MLTGSVMLPVAVAPPEPHACPYKMPGSGAIVQKAMGAKQPAGSNQNLQIQAASPSRVFLCWTVRPVPAQCGQSAASQPGVLPVSYTPLTLPTNFRVYLPVGGLNCQKKNIS